MKLIIIIMVGMSLLKSGQEITDMPQIRCTALTLMHYGLLDGEVELILVVKDSILKTDV